MAMHSNAASSSSASPSLRRRRPTSINPASSSNGRSLVVAADSAAAAAPASSSGGDTGESAAIVNTIKAIFGAGGFALPWAFAQGGTVLVSLCLAFSCVFALESLKMLVKAQEVLVDGEDGNEPGREEDWGTREGGGGKGSVCGMALKRRTVTGG